MAVLKLACADTHINELMVLAGAVSVLVGPFSSVIISYVCIFRAILRLQSGEGQSKAFSTCSSHLCVVRLFYGTAIIMYVGPRYGNPKEQKKYLLLFHSLFNPMLNPLIYTLKNSEVKNAMKRVLGIESFMKRWPHQGWQWPRRILFQKLLSPTPHKIIWDAYLK